MQTESPVLKKGQIKEKIAYGDYVTLARMLTVSTGAAQKRFLRGDPVAIEAMSEIVSTREELINKFKYK